VRQQGNYPLRKEVFWTVQYAAMVDLLEKAKLAGVRETASVRDCLDAACEDWLNRQDLREITDEEDEVLRKAFAEGFANYSKA
jgi:hypothetical protein